MAELTTIKVKHSGLWFYSSKGEIITIIETKDLDNLQLAISLTDKLAGKSSTEFYEVPMKKQ